MTIINKGDTDEPFNRTQPILIIGDYYKSLNQLFNTELSQFLTGKVLMIDYRVIPALYLYEISKKYQHLQYLTKDLFFIRINSIESFSALLDSKELSYLYQNGISSLIVNYPPFMFKTHENWILFKQLSHELVTIILTPKNLFPGEESLLFEVE